MRLSILLVSILLLGGELCQCKDSTADQLLVFEPNTEYVFQLKSIADMKSTQLDSTAKIGLILMHDLENGQEVYLDVHHLETTSAGHKVLLHEENNIGRWFSFQIRPNGTVYQVIYPANEESDVITLKKSITAMFSGHLNVTKENGENRWQYYAEESGTEGTHHSSYTASKSKEGVVFTKVRLTHPVTSGHASHEKEIHYHSTHRIPTKIKINEHFRAPNEPPAEYHSHDDGYDKAEDSNAQDFPEMTVTSQSEIVFLYSQERQPPKCLEKNLTTDTLHIKSIRKSMDGFNETTMWEFIKGNISCIREEQAKESFSDVHCFQDLVGVLQEIPESHMNGIVDTYFSWNRKQQSPNSMNKVVMMDALVATGLEYAQDLLTDTVFLSPRPNKYLVERFVMLSISNNKTISKHFVNTLQNFVNNPMLFPATLHDQSLQRTAVMALGGIAGNLKNLGRLKEATDLVTGIEDKLGVHDPWDYNNMLNTMSPDDQDHHNMNTAASVEALGNAALNQSYEHIMSYVNSSATQNILRRSGLHSLRNYGSKQVAELLLDVSQNDNDKQVRHVAADLYKTHPNAENISLDNDSFELQPQSNTLSEPLRRSRRSHGSGLIPDGGWEFTFPIEPVCYRKQTGSWLAGGQYGYQLKNRMKLRLGLLNGILEIEANNRAYAGFHVFRINVDLVTVNQCFDGAIEIRVNPFKEVKCAVVEQFLSSFDRIIKHYLSTQSDIIQDLFDSLEGEVSSQLDGFRDSLEFLGNKIEAASVFSKDAQERLSRLNPNLFQQGEVDDILQVLQTVHNLLTDLSDMRYRASHAVEVVLSPAYEQLMKAAEFMGSNVNFANVVKAPHSAIENIFEAFTNTKVATDAIVKVRQTLKEIGILGDEINPTWTRLPRTTGKLLSDLETYQSKWNSNRERAKRDVVGQQSQDEQFSNAVLEVLDELSTSVTQLRYVMRPILTVAKQFSDSTDILNRLFVQIRTSYLDTKHQIVQFLGPNVHQKFPREVRLAGGGCTDGFYPTTADGFYEDQGIDLITGSSHKVVSPYSGAVSRSGDNRIRLVPKGGGFLNTVVYIENIIPADIIPVDDFVIVVAGTVLGTTASTGPCGSNHIHFVVKSEIDPTPIDMREKRSNHDAKGVMDPSPYLNDRLLEIGAFKRGCDDITGKILGYTILRGSLTQPLKKEERPYTHNVDVSGLSNPRRTRRDAPDSSQTPSWFDGISMETLAKLGVMSPAFGKPYPVNPNANNMKVGNLLTFFHDIGSTDKYEEITNSLRTLAMQIANRHCVSPESLTDQQLTRELHKRGRSIRGSRLDLIRRFRSPDDRCPLLQLTIPKNTYCHIDPTCLAVECCLHVPMALNQVSVNAFVRYDPCLAEVFLGILNWKLTIRVTDQGLEVDTFAYLDLQDIGRRKMLIRYKMEKTDQLLLMSLSFSICPEEHMCMGFQDVFKESAFIISNCVSSDMQFRNEVDILDYFQRVSIHGLVQDSGQERRVATSLHEDAVKFWTERIATGNTTLTAEENMNRRISSRRDEYDKRNYDTPAGASTTMVPLQYLLQNVSGSQVGNLLHLPLENEGYNKWPGIDVIGGHLTEHGASVLVQFLLERTLPEVGLLFQIEDLGQLTSLNRTDFGGRVRRSTHDSLLNTWDTLLNGWEQWLQEHILDYAYASLPPEFVARDFTTSVTLRFPSRGRFYLFPLKRIFPLPIGIAVLHFEIGCGSGISIGANFKLAVGTMTYSYGIMPGVSVAGRATLAIGFFFFRIGFDVTIEILGTDLPISRESNYCKFPVEVTDRVDKVETPLAVHLHLRVWIKIWIFEITLFRKRLWSWSAPPLNKNIYNKQYTRNDDTVPKFFDSIVDQFIPEGNEDNKRSINEVISHEVTRSCLVQQVRELDYTEAAVYLQVAADDDISYFTYTLSVGTEPGGNELIRNQMFAGPSIFLTQGLLNGVPLYFTVRATNSQGGSATATCSLSTFDTTLPGGRVDTDFSSTSHPGILKASAVLQDDSEVTNRRSSVGVGIGVHGDQIIPWQILDSTKGNSSDITGNGEVEQFTSAKVGRLVSKPVAIMTFKNPNECLRACLDLPHSKCLSVNYDYSGSDTCELLEEIEGHGVTIQRSGSFSHFERLGVGHAVVIHHDDLPLVHNNLYYFNIYIYNVLGYENIVSSQGVLADFVPPEPGKIVNATQDQTIWEQCSTFTPEEWQDRCISDTSLPNHRLIVDGEGSQTVFNGHKVFKDLLFTKANEFISANWDGFHDNETGIFGYTWSVGSSICGDDVSEHIDPHSHLFDETEWNHNGIVDDIFLQDGQYFITVRAFNKVEFGGPMAITVCHTTPYTIDTTPPIMHDIWNVTYTLATVGVSINCSDSESGVSRSDFALGVTPRDTYILDWQLHPYIDFIEFDYKIPDGIPAWVRLRCLNNVDLAVTGHSDTALLVDSTPPVSGILYDGSKLGNDEEYFKDKTNICANWQDFHDEDSGISSYLLSFGSYPGGFDIVDLVRLEYDANVHCEGNVMLEHGQTYFATLIAFHGGIEMLNVSGSSNGVILDLTPPVPGYLRDGKMEDGLDLQYSSESATVSAFWDNFQDPESSIADYIISVDRQSSANGKEVIENIHEAQSVGNQEKSIEWHHFLLHHNDFVYVNLRTVNGADNHVDKESNGFRVDLTPPVLQALGDGTDVNDDMEYQTSADKISVHWKYEDLESGVISYQLAIYELKHGNKRKIYPADLDENSFKLIEDPSVTVHTEDGLQLKPGLIYTSMIKATNGAQLVASHETTGVRVDPSPPTMIYVRAGSVDGEHEELLDGYIYQSDRFGIKASWGGRDPQSQIKSYWVAVGSDVYLSDLREYRSEGPDNAGYISGLNLNLTSDNKCGDDCQPVYYVCVKAQNGAGQYSDVVCSSPIKVVAADQTGYVTDGPQRLLEEVSDSVNNAEIDAQVEAHAVTISFSGFASTLNGLRSFQWAIGTTPGGEDIQPYMTDGIVLTKSSNDSDTYGLSGDGRAQAQVDLNHGVSYFASVRATTGSGYILESTSDGFIVDQTPPDISLQELGKYRDHLSFEAQKETLYEEDTFSITASWTVTDTESAVLDATYYVATYPFGTDVSNMTLTQSHTIPVGSVKPTLKGKSNLVHVEATNTVGLRTEIIATSLVVDSSPPVPGKVLCPEYLHAGGMLQCQWSGFSDPESVLSSFNFMIGTDENRDDIFKSENISSYMQSYVVQVKHLNLSHNSNYFVTVEAVNAIGKTARAFSKPFLIDDTPPVSGVVVEFSDDDYNGLLGREHYLNADITCVESVSRLAVAWEPFTDDETNIVKYEVAIGTSPFGTQVKGYSDVGKHTTALIENVDLSYIRQAFVSVRGYNQAGLSSSVSSNGVFISRLSIGLPPLYPLRVSDGLGTSDSDFQKSLTQIDAAWDFSGYPCPFQRFEWAIYRIDGTEMQTFTDVRDQTYGTNSELDMVNGETFYVVVRGTNILGLSYTLRSDGITVQQDPLIPGHVFDGPFYGKDVNYQLSTDVLHASWRGFGGEKESQNVDHTGNDEISRSATSEQQVDYYEVAIGTDRGFAKTRHDIIAFRNVGTNTSVVFENLGLTPLSTVYVTIKAHSVSFASSEISSNGITVGYESFVSAGEISVPKFINSLDTVEFQWSGFESPLEMKFYYIAITDNLEFSSIDCKTVQRSNLTDFNVLPLEFANLDTYKRITGLRLKHLESYSIVVIGYDEGGECNSTSATFTVDSTPPLVGQIRTGPFFDMPLDYTTSSEELHVWWHGFQDDESGIQHHRIRLLSAPSCESNLETDLDIVIDWLLLSGNLTSYSFVNISLTENKPYVIVIETTNNAGSRNMKRSPPILLDKSIPTSGKVVDGVDFRHDQQFQGDTAQIFGSFLHLANPEINACPLQVSKFTDPNDWHAIDMIGLWNMDGIPWNIWYLHEQVEISEDVLEISLERDLRKPRVLSGGFSTDAHILSGGSYEVDIIAASDDMKAVTSIVFWNGQNNTIGGYREIPQSENEVDTCACCYWNADNTTCSCNCTEVMQSNLNENSTDLSNLLKVQSTTNMTESSMPSRGPQFQEDESSTLGNAQKACGLHIKEGQANWKAEIWCRYKEDEYDPISIIIDLPFDPSQDWHTYSLHFTETPLNAGDDDRKLDFYIDGEWKGEIDGIPELSDSTNIVLHVWNEDNFIPEVEDDFQPPTAVARFRKLRKPPPASNLCRYGDPFRGSTCPVVTYMAGVGSKPLTDDLQPYQEVAKPCIPCLHPCNRYLCDTTCPANVLQTYTYSLNNVTLPENPSDDNITTPVFMTVKSILANGESVTASSNGIVIDISPPVLDFMFYIDDKKSEYQPVSFQSSNTTIKAYWSFIDDESLITEYLWAIGSQPGATDMQNFTSIGLEQIGTNSDLGGSLFHNHTYYVTLKAINGAGLKTTIECPGITVLIQTPTSRGVNTTTLYTEELPPGIFPANSTKMSDGHHVGMSWTEADDPAVTRYEYCVGSSEEDPDDIVECIPVASNSSGSVRVADGGAVSISTESEEANLNMTDFPKSGNLNQTTGTNNTGGQGDFNLEPGKTVHNTIQVCNSADLCTPVESEATTIINDEDQMATSSNGSDITLPNEVNDTSSEARRKRSLDDYTLQISTTGGLQSGGTLVFGYLDEDRTNTIYESDAVTDYKPYVVNPKATMHKVSRELQNRLRFVYYPTFYLTSLGQVELKGPIVVNVTFGDIGNISESFPLLVFWNPDDQHWHDAAKSCRQEDTSLLDLEKQFLSVKVCSTRTPKSSMRKRRAADAQQYFSRETHFAVISVSLYAINEPPVIQNPQDTIVIREDQGTAYYQFVATDSDGDQVKFVIDPDQQEPTNGMATITEDGLFAYTPCRDCNGEDTFAIIVEEMQEVQEILPSMEKFTFKVIITEENDEPELFVAHNGSTIGSHRNAHLIVEENTGHNLAYTPLTLVIGAYDIDLRDRITLKMEGPFKGKLALVDEIRNITEDNRCNSDHPIYIPCGLEVPHCVENMVWLISNFTYTPHFKEYGNDELHIYAEDRTGSLSRLLTIYIGIFANPCINGFCKGPENDTDCSHIRRTRGFNGYMCECLPGFFGNYCEIDATTANDVTTTIAATTVGDVDNAHTDQKRSKSVSIALSVVAVILIIVVLCILALIYKRRKQREQKETILFLEDMGDDTATDLSSKSIDDIPQTPNLDDNDGIDDIGIATTQIDDCDVTDAVNPLYDADLSTNEIGEDTATEMNPKEVYDEKMSSTVDMLQSGECEPQIIHSDTEDDSTTAEEMCTPMQSLIPEVAEDVFDADICTDLNP